MAHHNEDTDGGQYEAGPYYLYGDPVLVLGTAWFDGCYRATVARWYSVGDTCEVKSVTEDELSGLEPAEEMYGFEPGDDFDEVDAFELLRAMARDGGLL